MGPEDLYALASEYLDACIEALDTVPDSAPGFTGSPARTFISHGAPAFDCCDQLAVQVRSVFSDNPQPLKNSMRENIVTLVAWSTRCVPTIDSAGNIPTEVELSASSEQLYADGWALWNHIFNLIRAEQLFTLCGQVIWDGLVAVNPQGGCAGWTLTVRVSTDGYESVVSS